MTKKKDETDSTYDPDDTRDGAGSESSTLSQGSSKGCHHALTELVELMRSQQYSAEEQRREDNQQHQEAERRREEQHKDDMKWMEERFLLMYERVKTERNQPQLQPPMLTPLQDRDEVDIYFSRFEQQMGAYHIPNVDWTIHLLPLLTGQSLAAYGSLSKAESTQYDKVKEAVLHCFGVDRETYRRWWWQLRKRAEETYTQYGHRLANLTDRYIEKLETKEEVASAFLMGKILTQLPTEVAFWVKGRSPTTLPDICKLADDYVREKGQETNPGRRWKSEQRPDDRRIRRGADEEVKEQTGGVQQRETRCPKETPYQRESEKKP